MTRTPSPRQEIGRGQADDAAAEDQDVRVLRHAVVIGVASANRLR